MGFSKKKKIKKEDLCSRVWRIRNSFYMCRARDFGTIRTLGDGRAASSSLRRRRRRPDWSADSSPPEIVGPHKIKDFVLLPTVSSSFCSSSISFLRAINPQYNTKGLDSPKLRQEQNKTQKSRPQLCRRAAIADCDQIKNKTLETVIYTGT